MSPPSYILDRRTKQVRKTHPPRDLLIAIGNSGRSDDGLGWAFAEALGQSGHFKGDIAYRYQLQVEDAELISRYDRIYFVDACHDSLPDGSQLEQLQPRVDFAFSTHALEPASILGLCTSVYDITPEAYLLRIEGREWDLNIGLSVEARGHLEKALGKLMVELANHVPRL